VQGSCSAPANGLEFAADAGAIHRELDAMPSNPDPLAKVVKRSTPTSSDEINIDVIQKLQKGKVSRASLELATSCVLDTCDNPYTIRTCTSNHETMTRSVQNRDPLVNKPLQLNKPVKSL
jgi:hypothetical protein